MRKIDIERNWWMDHLPELRSSSVNDRSRKIIMLRYGLPNGEICTLEEAGRAFGVTRERARQIIFSTRVSIERTKRAAQKTLNVSLDSPLSKLDLRPRIEFALLKNDFKTIRDLIVLTPGELRDKPGVGVHAVTSVIEALSRCRVNGQRINLTVPPYELDHLGFSESFIQRLENHDIRTLRDLTAKTAEELLAIDFIGGQKLREIRSSLRTAPDGPLSLDMATTIE